eukprot:SAG22_NODE_21097_length_260_cov_0.639752_1_plen_61_part_01
MAAQIASVSGTLCPKTAVTAAGPEVTGAPRAASGEEARPTKQKKGNALPFGRICRRSTCSE